MCKEMSHESKGINVTMNNLLEGLKSELFTDARESELREIVETVFTEHMNNVRERIKVALSVCMDSKSPVANSLKFRPSYDFHSMTCEVMDAKSSSNVVECIPLSVTCTAYFSEELNDLLCYRRFCNLLSQKFMAAGFDDALVFTVDIARMMHEYING